jgi:hypothetical protein
MKTIFLALAFAMIFHTTCIAQDTKPRFEIDHIIITTQKGAPETKTFEQNGFAISPFAAELKGVGAKYINFYNVFLELLYVNDPLAIQPKSDTLLPPPRDKWREKGQSPFGLGLSMIPYDTTQIPIEAKKVQAEWMKPNTGIFSATSNLSHEQEPIVLVVHPSTVKPSRNTMEEIRKDIEQWTPNEATRRQFQQTFQHPNQVKKLTGLKITCKTSQLSPTIQTLKAIEDWQIVEGNEHLLEMTFDKNRQKKTVDFRPELPVIIKF